LAACTVAAYSINVAHERCRQLPLLIWYNNPKHIIIVRSVESSKTVKIVIIMS